MLFDKIVAISVVGKPIDEDMIPDFFEIRLKLLILLLFVVPLMSVVHHIF
jgi:hypothetical protein